MKCPKCEGDVRIIDCVNTQYNEVYRKRKCTKCSHVLYTCECIVYPDSEFKEEWNLSHRSSYVKKKEEKKNEV